MSPLCHSIWYGPLLISPALACGSKAHSNIPGLASSIDDLLPNAKQITKLAASGRRDEARQAEEEAIALLGYRKMLLKCGPGTFSWMKVQYQ